MGRHNKSLAKQGLTDAAKEGYDQGYRQAMLDFKVPVDPKTGRFIPPPEEETAPAIDLRDVYRLDADKIVKLDAVSLRFFLPKVLDFINLHVVNDQVKKSQRCVKIKNTLTLLIQEACK